MGYGHLVSSVATQAPTPMESPIPRNQPDLLESCRRRHAEKHRGTNSAKTTGQPIQVSAELKAVGERRNSTGSTGPEEALIRTMRRTSAKKNHSAKNQNSERLARPCGDAYLRKHAGIAPKKPGIFGALGSDGGRVAESAAEGFARTARSPQRRIGNNSSSLMISFTVKSQTPTGASSAPDRTYSGQASAARRAEWKEAPKKKDSIHAD